MLNNEINSLQDALAILNNYNNYTTYIEVSRQLYDYLNIKLKNLSDEYICYSCDECSDFYKDINKVKTLYGCEVFINPSFKGFDYKICRKEND